MKYQVPQNIKLIIGLGNPESQYGQTYHNAGFLFINKMSDYGKFKNNKNFEYLKINGLIFIKPLVFMNESSKAVFAAMKYFKAKPEEILIVHDDSDIEIGKFKISFGRGSAGHNGVESIIKSLKTKDFWRLRIGIRPQKSKQKAEKFVLKKISKKDLEILEKVFKEAAGKI